MIPQIYKIVINLDKKTIIVGSKDLDSIYYEEVFSFNPEKIDFGIIKKGKETKSPTILY